MIIPSNCKRLNALVYFAYDYNIYADTTDESNPTYISISERSANNLFKSVFVTLGMFFISIIIYAIFPIYHLIMHHDIHLLVPVLFPFTDIASVNGILINMVNQLFTASIGISGTFGIEVVVCMLKNSFDAISCAVCYSIDELVTTFNESNPLSNRIVKIHFRNIVIQLEDFDRYTFWRYGMIMATN